MSSLFTISQPGPRSNIHSLSGATYPPRERGSAGLRIARHNHSKLLAGWAPRIQPGRCREAPVSAPARRCMHWEHGKHWEKRWAMATPGHARPSDADADAEPAWGRLARGLCWRWSGTSSDGRKEVDKEILTGCPCIDRGVVALDGNSFGMGGVGRTGTGKSLLMGV